MQYYWTHGFLLDNMFVALVCRWRRQVMSLFMYDVVLFLIYSCQWIGARSNWVHRGFLFYTMAHCVVAAPTV